MQLNQLLKGIPVQHVHGPKEVLVKGITSDSRFVAPGDIFLAKKGMTVDGSLYIPNAVTAGASVIVTDLYDPSLPPSIVQVIYPRPRAIEGALAANVFNHPDKELFLVGITGTNGKTTTAYIVKHILDHLGESTGLIGTIAYMIGNQRHNATHTTPDVCVNYKLLREMRHAGCQAAVMEVTSHALSQNRVSHLDFDAALFTNLTQDHLDYHGTMEQYCAAKNKLFRTLSSKQTKKHGRQKVAIVNIDNSWHTKMLAGCSTKQITYSLENPSDIQATDLELTPSGTHFHISYQGKKTSCFTPLIGRYNVYNTLAALALMLHLGHRLETLMETLKSLPAVPGRLARVPNSLGLEIYIDFAHSDDALTKVFETLKILQTKRILTVVGCGGDRDKTKRPLMGRVSEMYSDITILTSDNPRTEDPEAIIQDITHGFKDPNRYQIRVDRKEAISHALTLAEPGDILLIAGRGHERVQVLAHNTIEFDDYAVTQALCKEMKGAPVS